MKDESVWRDDAGQSEAAGDPSSPALLPGGEGGRGGRPDSWRPEAIEKLRALAPDHTAAEVAEKLGVSRAVAGSKAHRLGIKFRDGERRPSASSAGGRPGRPGAWTAERDAELVRLAPDRTVSFIAERFGLTRSAVSGRAHRLGVRFREGARAPVWPPAEQKAAPPRAPRPAAGETPAGKRSPPREPSPPDEAAAARLAVAKARRETPPKTPAAPGEKGASDAAFVWGRGRPDAGGARRPIALPGDAFALEALFSSLENRPPRPLVELRARDCRWPVRGADGETLFCAAEAADGEAAGGRPRIARRLGLAPCYCLLHATAATASLAGYAARGRA